MSYNYVTVKSGILQPRLDPPTTHQNSTKKKKFTYCQVLDWTLMILQTQLDRYHCSLALPNLNLHPLSQISSVPFDFPWLWLVPRNSSQLLTDLMIVTIWPGSCLFGSGLEYGVWLQTFTLDVPQNAPWILKFADIFKLNSELLSQREDSFWPKAGKTENSFHSSFGTSCKKIQAHTCLYLTHVHDLKH